MFGHLRLVHMHTSFCSRDMFNLGSKVKLEKN